MMPAARFQDMLFCPFLLPVPHVGSPIYGVCVPNVLIGGMPTATLGDFGICLNSIPNPIVKGSATVLVGGRPAARIGDNTAHGGFVATGFPTVLIGG